MNSTNTVRPVTKVLEMVNKEAHNLDNATGCLQYNQDILEYTALSLTEMLEGLDIQGKKADLKSLALCGMALNEALQLARILYDYILKNNKPIADIDKTFNALWDMTVAEEVIE